MHNMRQSCGYDQTSKIVSRVEEEMQAFSFETGHFWPIWYLHVRRPGRMSFRTRFQSVQGGFGDRPYRRQYILVKSPRAHPLQSPVSNLQFPPVLPAHVPSIWSITKSSL